jgi:hypothetical protein
MNRNFIILFFVIVLFSFNNIIAQGGVNVKLIQVDFLDSSYLNKEIKIDFKNTLKTDQDPSFSLKDLWTSHTKITINNKLIEITEYNGRGTDYWYYDKAFLELHNYKPNLNFRVSKVIIREIKTDSIKFQWTIEPYNSDENNHTEITQEIRDVWIRKESIESILIKTN